LLCCVEQQRWFMKAAGRDGSHSGRLGATSGPQDGVDVERIVVRQTGKLDWTYVREQLRPLAERNDVPEILDQLERRRRRKWGQIILRLFGWPPAAVRRQKNDLTPN
jgi:hypothetical protein